MRVQTLAVPLAIVACVAVASPLHTPLNNPNEGVRVFATKALVEQGTLAIDEVVAQWGYIDDKAQHGGHLYSSKAPLTTLVAAVGYALLHPVTGDLTRATLTRVARLFGSALPCLAMALAVWIGLRRRLDDPAIADVSVVGMVLGSGVLASINVLSGHGIAALAPAVALVFARGAVDEAPRVRRVRLAGVGLVLAAAVGAEYPALLMAVPLGALVVWCDRRRDTLLWLALGALPVVLAVGGAQMAMFGAPWRTGYSFLENRQYQEVVAGTLFGIGAPDPLVWRAVLASPAVGLWFFSPVLAVGAAVVLADLRRHDQRVQAIAVVAASVLLLLFIAGFRGWRGGWSVGPRYVSELIGLWAVPAATWFDRLARTRPSTALASLAALVAVGVVHSGVAGMFFPHLSDAFANPVYEMMLPFVARGFAPASLPLLLGASPALAVFACVLVLAAPLAFAVVLQRRARAVRGVAAAVGAVVLALVVGPLLPGTAVPVDALEARRMMDNWRPEEGNPVLARDPARSPRTLLAIDRGRDALPMLLRSGCAPAGPAAPARDLRAPLHEVMDTAPPGALVVLDDAYALALADLTRAAAVALVRTDLDRWRGPLPCTGNVYVVARQRAPLQRALARLEVVERRAVDAGGFELLVLRRADAPPAKPPGG